MAFLKANFSLNKKPQFWGPANPRNQTWHNRVYSIIIKLRHMVSFKTSQGTWIYNQNAMNVRKYWNTIMDFSWGFLNAVYQFFAFWWWFLIGIRSGNLEEAIETRIRSWIVLEWCFQNWLFWQFFQVCEELSCAALCSSWLGLCSSICSECIRSKKLNQIHCIHWFGNLIF